MTYALDANVRALAAAFGSDQAAQNNAILAAQQAAEDAAQRGRDSVPFVNDFGASTTATGDQNLAAFEAALAASEGTINLQTTGTYTLSGPLRYTGVNKVLQGAGGELASLNFEDGFDGPAIVLEPANPLENVTRSGNGLANIVLSGNGSDRPNRWALDIRKQELFRLDNVRWGGFSFGLRVAGGQLGTFSRFYGFGSGRTAGAELAGSTHLHIGPAANETGVQPQYTSTFSNYILTGSSAKNVQDIITLQQSDGCQFVNGYVAYGARSLLRLDQGAAQNITATSFTNTYFDGVNTTTGTPHWIGAKDSTAVGSVTMEFSNIFAGNFTGDIFALGGGNGLRALRFIGGNVSTSATGLGTIKGQSGVNGLRLTSKGTTFRGAPSGLTIDGAALVDMDATFDAIPDAVGALKLMGTINQKKWSIAFNNCVSRVTDTSSGSTSQPSYNWTRAFPLVVGDGVQLHPYDNGAGKLLRTGAFGRNGATEAALRNDFTVEFVSGVYRGNSSNVGYNGPDVAGWAYVFEVSRSEGDMHHFTYRRASGSSPKMWIGYRATLTGAVVWNEVQLVSAP